jgi:hypothetical protein
MQRERERSEREIQDPVVGREDRVQEGRGRTEWAEDDAREPDAEREGIRPRPQVEVRGVLLQHPCRGEIGVDRELVLVPGPDGDVESRTGRGRQHEHEERQDHRFPHASLPNRRVSDRRPHVKAPWKMCLENGPFIAKISSSSTHDCR